MLTGQQTFAAQFLAAAAIASHPTKELVTVRHGCRIRGERGTRVCP